MPYIFGNAEEREINDVFALYRKRVDWMDKAGIRQWNTTGYLTAYPPAYYREQEAAGTLYVLRRKDTGLPVGAVVLLSSDAGWPDSDTVSAFYLHRLVTDPAVRGAGKRLIAEAEKLAVSVRKTRVRLDCAADNAFLNRYYEALGYLPCGLCTDGPYTGIRREKLLGADGGSLPTPATIPSRRKPTAKM